MNHDQAKAHVRGLLDAVFSGEADVSLSNADPRTIFLNVSWQVHGLGKDRRSVPIRFVIDGGVIDELTRLDEEQTKLFEEHFLSFVDSRMSGYHHETGMAKGGHGSAFDILFEKDDLKSFYDALAAR